MKNAKPVHRRYRRFRQAGLTSGIAGFRIVYRGQLVSCTDETHNDDGRHVQYLEDTSLRSCDEDLWLELKRIVSSGKREVSALQKAQLIDAVFFPDLLSFSGTTKAERISMRKTWHRKALDTLSNVDIVFVDPDNGLLVPSAEGTLKENKFVKPDELAGYYCQGSSVVYYQHKARVSDSVYIEKHKNLLLSSGFEGASELSLKFLKTSLRYYFFIVQPFHKAVITEAVEQMLGSAWSNCFALI